MPETRTVTQYRVFRLFLNPMTDRYESTRLVAASDDYQRLVNWYNSLKVPMYSDQVRDYTYRKQFKKDSELEWFNPADNIALNEVDDYGRGISEEWIEEEVYVGIFVNKSRNNFVII